MLLLNYMLYAWVLYLAFFLQCLVVILICGWFEKNLHTRVAFEP